MITQILGVALISLLNITPTLQQNNIEQLIAPNIETQDTTFTPIDSNRVYVNRQFSYYHWDNNPATIDIYKAVNLYTSFDRILWNNTDYTFSVQDITRTIFILNDNLYVSAGSIDITGNALRALLENYYFRTRGGNPTSSIFSFTQTTQLITNTTTYYTYTLNGSQGQVNGRIYIQSSSTNPISFSVTNNNVTVPLGTSLADIINNYIQPINNSSRQSIEEANNTILYYFLGSTLPTVAGTHTVSLRARNNYGRWSVQNVTVNLFQDSTPPTIISINGNSTNWTNQDITLTVQASDNVGLNSNAYSFDNGATYQASNSKTYTTNEIVNIKVRDSSNNETSQQEIINRIDKQSPAILLAGNWKNTFELGELANNQELLTYLSISDGASGLNNGLTTISNFNYNQAGSYSNIQVSATDNAGNTNVYTLPTVTITQPADNTGPIITGPTIVNVVEGNILTESILDLYSISDISGIEPNTISIRDLNNNVITNWESYTTGSYQLRVYARDTLNNITQYQFTLQVGEAPPPDLTPPTIVGPLLVSFEIGTYTSNTEILNLYTFTDNVGILQNQLIGEIDYSELGDYQVIIRSTDTSNNVTNRNVVVRIRDEVILGNYNPLTDLLSGIFGGALSMIFTIGTINILGLRLLDAMGVIILGAVLMFVYKAIKGGS
jgi:hypothetical protein